MWVRATVVRPGELGEPELARWRDLQAAQLEQANPFLTAGFARVVDQVSDRARVAAFEDGSTIVGFLPFELSVRGVGTAIGRKLNPRQGLVHESGLPWSWSQVLDATNLDVLVATDLSLTTERVFAGWFSAHDPERSKASPGAIRTLRTVEAAFDRGVIRVDLSRGESYKDTLKTSDAEVATGFVSRPSLRALAFQAAHVPAAAARSFVLDHPEVRNLVRESLKQLGAVRETLDRR